MKTFQFKLKNKTTNRQTVQKVTAKTRKIENDKRDLYTLVGKKHNKKEVKCDLDDFGQRKLHTKIDT